MKLFTKVKDVNVAPLVYQLEAHPELWNQFGFRKGQDAHKEMSDIWVRYNRPELIGKPEFNDQHIPVWYPAWEVLTELRPIIFGLMADVQGEMLGGVLITRIPPGKGIGPHVDKSWHVDYYRKYYVSLKSAEGAMFCSKTAYGGEEALNPKPGEIWEFDNHYLHWVDNRSHEDRITLIVCIRS